MSKKNKTKNKLRTSREVYDQILWDPSLDETSFWIGYNERFRGLTETPFAEFASQEIPWHRIQHIRHERGMAWDRNQRIDQVARYRTTDSTFLRKPQRPSAPSPKPQTTTSTKTTSITTLPVWKYDANEDTWVSHEAKENSPPLPTRWRWLTWNILYDLYDAEKIYTEQRIPSILRELQSHQADVIALQEVTAPFLKRLLQQSWVRRSYFVSSLPEGESIEPYGQLLLAKAPFDLRCLRFSTSKRALIAQFQQAQKTLEVAAVHLTSSRHADAQRTREKQLTDLLKHMPFHMTEKNANGTQIILGDFNYGDDNASTHLEDAGFVDLWHQKHPDQPGFTFDPMNNSLAQIVSLTGQARRLDRVYIRQNPTTTLPSIQLFGAEPFAREPNTLYLSDHLGLQGEWTDTDTKQTPPIQGPLIRVEASPIHQSALVILPPEELWGPIQEIRNQHDKSFARWMPHINLIYGFVGPDFFDQAVKAIQPTLASWQPFSVELDVFSYFQHRKSSTVWLRPKTHPTAHLVHLQAALQSHFPHCTSQSERSEHGFTPHLTVAQFRNNQRTEMRTYQKQWQQNWAPLRFEVSEVALLQRTQDSPFTVAARVPLGPPQQASSGLKDPIQVFVETPTNSFVSTHPLLDFLEQKQLLESEEKRQRNLEIELRLEELCLESLAPEWPSPSCGVLHTLGSGRLDVLIAKSDLDFLCIGPSALSHATFFERLAKKLAKRPNASNIRTIANAFVPTFKALIQGQQVDLLYAQFPPNESPCPPEQLQANDLKRFAIADRYALVSCLEADRLRTMVRKTGRLSLYQEVLRAVKAWAYTRWLDANAYGYLSGISWAELVAYVFCHAEEHALSDASTALATFFRTFASWDWRHPVRLEANDSYKAQRRRDRMPILTTVPPIQNTARNVSRSTRGLLEQELKRAHQCLKTQGSTPQGWGVLYTAPEWVTQFHQYIELGIPPESQSPNGDETGWLEAQLLSLVIPLERKQHAWICPIPRMFQSKKSAEDQLEKRLYLGIRPSHQGADFPFHSKEVQQTLHEFSESFRQTRSFCSEPPITFRFLSQAQFRERMDHSTQSKA